jgi:hypothetical protein
VTTKGGKRRGAFAPGRLMVSRSLGDSIAAATLEIMRQRRRAAELQAQAEAEAREELARKPRPPADEWIEANFYEPDTGQLIELTGFQRAVLRYATQRNAAGDLRWRTVIWSQPKKSGKTAISGAVGRWAAETWGPFQLVLFVGNDADQARDRGFAALSTSVELTPGYDGERRRLPGRWRLLDSVARASNGSQVRAIAADYTGEAGANPSMTVYTELWGFIHEAAKRFWAEMAPSPTRQNSVRWVETYAGYEGESDLLWGLYETTVVNGRQLTAGELSDATQTPLGVFAEAQQAGDPVPCYVDESAGMFCFWDTGVEARRMPWQQGERGAAYYAAENGSQTPKQMRRIHENEWVSTETAFVPMEAWDACYRPLPLQPGERTPLVLALDAGVSGDCFGLVVVSRDPDNPTDGVAERHTQIWTPPPGGSIDYSGPEAAVRDLAARYNVAEVAYDPYQLHDMATRLMREGVAWFRPFPQGDARLLADKALQDRIMAHRLRHNGSPDLRDHVRNANAKQGKNEDTKLRIVKRSESAKIDSLVCLSMGAAECARLSL